MRINIYIDVSLKVFPTAKLNHKSYIILLINLHNIVIFILLDSAKLSAVLAVMIFRILQCLHIFNGQDRP